LTSRRAATPYPLVTTPDALSRALEEAHTARALGLDTEFLRERTYRGRLCLVQIATRGQGWLIDPLAPLDLTGIGTLLADAEVDIVVHAGKQDLELFYEAFGAIPRSVFDVQIAAGFAGYGSSLAYGTLVEATLGVPLPKGESYTDWCRRPLTDEQRAYASDDVRYLLEVADHLRQTLERLGRLRWAEDEMRALSAEASYRVDPWEMWRRVAGRGHLSPRQLGVLREVARWREQEAARRDLPRGWLLKDPTLVEIARRAPATVAVLKSIRGLNPKEADRSGRELLAAVERGKRDVPEPRAAVPRAALLRARALAGLADAVVRARCERAGIATDLVATRGELESLLVALASGCVDESSHRLLRGWRRDLAGNAVLALASGRLAVKSSERPPYIEEIEV
jgi:ribonuclease D